MPEAPVNEDNRAIPGKEEIRTARQSPVVQAKTKALAVQGAAQQDLWSRVLASYASHHS
jgi:hypothetical protein